MEVISRQLIVLVADDSDDVRAVVGGILRSLGHVATEVRTGKEAVAFLSRTYFDVVVTDLVTGDGGGLEIIEETKRRYATARILVMWDESQVSQSLEFATTQGAHGSIRKPFTAEEFLTVLQGIIPPPDTPPPFSPPT